jgi:DNA polymerase I-like protein with 3'-5' exonuclease and polymerase domains
MFNDRHDCAKCLKVCSMHQSKIADNEPESSSYNQLGVATGRLSSRLSSSVQNAQELDFSDLFSYGELEARVVSHIHDSVVLESR